MYQLNSLEDTIVAIGTPMGQGGIGIVRLSGRNTLAICDQLFVSKNKKKPSQFKSFTVHYGWVVRWREELSQGAWGRPASQVRSSGWPPTQQSEDKKDPTDAQKNFEILDEALLTLMRAPKSYTTEDVAEISCHGGMVVLYALVQLIVDLGARLAEPGEFTKRAFLNGRLDLTQAEAVLDIIQAKTDRFLRMSLHQLKGELSTELEGIREHLLRIYVQMEAIVNFPEDDLDASPRMKLTGEIQSARNRVDHLLQSSEQGRILKDGIRIVICGKPNVGKSSLLNVLLKTPRAIVTDIAGTTRDTIEETLQIKGIPFQLIDTAGILEPRDLLEAEAIRRSHLYINSADLILFVVDGSDEITPENELLIQNISGKNVLVVLNKCDLEQKIAPEEIRQRLGDNKVIKVSALKKILIEDLEDTIVENVAQGRPIDQTILISNVRHVQALKDCSAALARAEGMTQDGLSFEFVSEEIKLAVNFLDNLTGRNIDRDLLEKIFSEFCIGK